MPNVRLKLGDHVSAYAYERDEPGGEDFAGPSIPTARAGRRHASRERSWRKTGKDGQSAGRPTATWLPCPPVYKLYQDAGALPSEVRT